MAVKCQLNERVQEGRAHTARCAHAEGARGRAARAAALAQVQWHAPLFRSHTGIPYLNLVRRKMASSSIPPYHMYGEFIKHVCVAFLFIAFFSSKFR